MHVSRVGCVDWGVFHIGKQGVEKFAGKTCGTYQLTPHRSIPYFAIAIGISLISSLSSNEIYVADNLPVAKSKLPLCPPNPALPADVNDNDDDENKVAIIRYTILTFSGGIFYADKY